MNKQATIARVIREHRYHWPTARCAGDDVTYAPGLDALLAHEDHLAEQIMAALGENTRQDGGKR